MTTLVLVVDDRPTNVLLLETKLASEYYDVITARDGYEALQKTKERSPDLILLDVMMPGIDGFEVCRRLKSDPETAHIPVIMITALSSRSDRLRGFEAGADDFLTKPFNDVVFFARTKALARTKQLFEELRLRDKVLADFGTTSKSRNLVSIHQASARVLLISDREEQNTLLREKLATRYEVMIARSDKEVQDLVVQHRFDVFLVDTLMESTEGLRLAARLKSNNVSKDVPIIIIVSESRTQSMLKALELGINDYILLPYDDDELLARVKTQVQRHQYQLALSLEVEPAIEPMVKDKETGLFNGYFLAKYLDCRAQAAQKYKKSISLLAIGIDCRIPDNMARDAHMIRGITQHVIYSIRTGDMAVHMGDGRFILLIPESNLLAATAVAERICKKVESSPLLHPSQPERELRVTVSVGVAQLTEKETGTTLLERALEALENARQHGENHVQLASKG